MDGFLVSDTNTSNTNWDSRVAAADALVASTVSDNQQSQQADNTMDLFMSSC